MRIITILFLMLALLSPAGAQESTRLSLNDALEYGAQHNTTAVNARLSVEIARKRVWESTASGLPQLNASVSYQDMLKLPVSLIPAEFFGGTPGTFQEISFGTQHNVSADITVSQLVFSGPYIVGLQASRSYQMMQEQNLDKTVRDVKAQVAEAYYYALLSKEMSRIMKSSYDNLTQTYTDVAGMVSAGLLDATEADQLRIALTRLGNSSRNLDRQLLLAMNLLKFQIGMGLDAELELTDSLQGIVDNINIDALVNTGFDKQNNLDYKAATTGLILTQQQLNLEKSSYLPSLTAFYTYRENAMRNEFDFLASGGKWFESSILGVSLNIPIASSGMKNAKVQQARMTFEQTQNNVEMLERSLEMEAMQSRFDLRTAYENYLVQEESIGLAKKILDHTLFKYKAGLASSMDVTQASDQLLQAETTYSTALVDILNAKVRLDKVMSRF